MKAEIKMYVDGLTEAEPVFGESLAQGKIVVSYEVFSEILGVIPFHKRRTRTYDLVEALELKRQFDFNLL